MRRLYRFPRVSLVSFFLVVLVCVPSPQLLDAAGREIPSFRILAGPYAKKTAQLGGPTTSRFTVDGLSLLVDFMEPAQRRAFIQTLDPAAEDPFAVGPGRPEYYHAFRVTFDNRSRGDVTFQPGNVILITDRHSQQFPVDLTDLYRLAVHAETSDPEVMIDRVAPLIFDSSTTIPKGERLARLLVFGPLPEKWKEFHLHFSFLQIGTETHTVSFTFHRQTLRG